jgi:4-hydroxy-3-methylbut-2-enyl diphosphate reductase
MTLEARLISAGAPRVRVLRTGIGRRRSRAAASSLRHEALCALLIMGFGGGLDRESRPGEVVVADELHGPEGMRVVCPGADILAQALLNAGIAARRGAVASAGYPAVGLARELLRGRGAIAADMESIWLAAGARGRPFGVVRVLLDSPAREPWRPWFTLTGLLHASLALRWAAAVLAAEMQRDDQAQLQG